eukprot:CAMPEP_0179171480 /NCGR_PEP_ID=MMETSP0796-20121207/84532_1 /TAXON_ID=73915 /ORGANISM="Pyrodinium bahamense, Strain pbaha01" /LENGTH=169 /DNA_ID=CAMNT_0020874553 /DNA_START=89 /DNA_END=595 /DNA_ORIENTATION=+
MRLNALVLQTGPECGAFQALATRRDLILDAAEPRICILWMGARGAGKARRPQSVQSNRGCLRGFGGHSYRSSGGSSYGGMGQPRAASALAQSCYAAQALIRPGAGITVGNPAAQNAIVHSGAAALALRAMKEYPASFEVQLACGYMLCHTATWNVENQRELGEAGAFQV